MFIPGLSIVGVIFFLISISMYLSIQDQLLRAIGECNICRREIMTTEEILCCPICQTIYHANHLNIWLKIKNKCPICRNKITTSYKKAIVCSKEMRQKKQTLSGYLPIISNYINLKCSHCQTNIDFRLKKESDQCHICGSRIFWPNRAQRFKLINKKLNRLYSNNNRNRKPINKPQKKINDRKIKRMKEQEKKQLQDSLQEQTRLELLDDILLINQEYFRERKISSIYKQNFVQEVLEESNRRKKSYFTCFNMAIITCLGIQIIFLGIAIFKLIN